MKTEERRLQLIEDTVLYYSQFSRSMCYDEEGDYFYPCFSGDTSKLNTAGDALGRLLTPQRRNTIDKIYGETPLENLWNELPKEILELGQHFLIELCVLHDNSSFWEDKKLSEEGLEFVLELKSKFC